MSTETLIKENSKNTKLDPRGSEKVYSDPKISNLKISLFIIAVFNELILQIILIYIGKLIFHN